MIAEIDQKLSRSSTQILHNEEFQKLESAWRGLKFVVDRTDFRQNIKIEMLNVSKDDLLTDFEDSPEVVKSGLYKHVYTAEYGQFGGKPVGAIVANYDFGPGRQDVKLAAVAAPASARWRTRRSSPRPAPQMFGVENFEEIAEPQGSGVDLRGPAVREVERVPRNARTRATSALTMPRFLLRLPYGPETTPVKAFNYEERRRRQHDNYLWGNASFALRHAADRQLRQVPLVPEHHRPAVGRRGREPAAPQVRGDGPDPDQDPDRGADLRPPRVRARRAGLHRPDHAQGQRQRRVLLGQLGAEAEELRQHRRGQGGRDQLQARHAAALHVHRSTAWRTTSRCCSASRSASWKNRGELESELNNWIRQYVADQDNPSAGRAFAPAAAQGARSRSRTSRASRAGTASAWRCQPHFKYMGADFTLSLKGKLDKA